jgi:geranylgeranyl reductase family protein
MNYWLTLSSQNFDVIIAGAGIAGCSAANVIARSGYRVALIDALPESKIGMKVCGDGVALHDFYESNIPPPTKKEIEREVDEIKFFTNSQTYIFSIIGKGLTVNRYHFGQRLLKDAQDQGAQLFSKRLVTGALLSNGKVLGITTKQKEDKTFFKAPITFDTTGIVASVRTSLPSTLYISESINVFDTGIGYREYRQLDKSFGNFCAIHYNWDISHGGYCWIIPKRDNLVNTGILIPSSRNVDANFLMNKFSSFVKMNTHLKKSKCLKSEIGLVPLRHPLLNAVSDGLISIGDSAFHTNPLNGYGIGPAMLSSKIATETAIFCLEKNKFSRNDLWKFNYNYMLKYGKRYTTNKIMKDFIQTLNQVETEYFFKSLGIKKRYKSANFIKELSNPDKIKLLYSLSKKRSLFNKFLRLIIKIKSVSSHFDKYPKSSLKYNIWLNELTNKL